MRYYFCIALVLGLLLGCEARITTKSEPAPSRVSTETITKPTPNESPFVDQADRFVDTTYHVVCYEYWRTISCAPYFPEPTNPMGE